MGEYTIYTPDRDVRMILSGNENTGYIFPHFPHYGRSPFSPISHYISPLYTA